MEHLTSALNNSTEYHPNVVLDLNVLNEDQKGSNIDFMKASVSELSSVIVSEMIESVKTDLSSIKIEEEANPAK
ncbi:MAG: hypothetical protein AAF789_01745 [Bacteroidota bacterium]